MALYEVPGMGNVEFPDNMPIEDVEKAIQASVGDQQAPTIAEGVAREAGVAARGAINPISTGAAIGGALAAPTGVGIPVGIGAGALAGLLVELGADYYNKLIAPKLGTGKQMLPSEALDQLKDQLGLPRPETPIEKLTSGEKVKKAAGKSSTFRSRHPSKAPSPIHCTDGGTVRLWSLTQS